MTLKKYIKIVVFMKHTRVENSNNEFNNSIE